MKRILLLLATAALTGCESLTPAERAALLNTGLSLVNQAAQHAFDEPVPAKPSK